jgi:dipeptidyl aminopeptidase/acylaminoacyl peptidase
MIYSRVQWMCRDVLIVLILCLAASPVQAQEKRTLTFVDLMQFRQIENPSISRDGRWIAFAAMPDRGDPEVVVRSTDGEAKYTVALGMTPAISADGAWVAMRLEPTLEAKERAKDKKEDEKPRPGLAVLRTADGEVLRWEEVTRFAFSSDGAWVARLHHAPRKQNGEDEEAEVTEAEETVPLGEPPTEPEPEEVIPPGEEPTPEEVGVQEEDEKKPRERKKPGTLLVLRNLASGVEDSIQHVARFAFAEEGSRLAFVVASPEGRGDGIQIVELAGDGFTTLAWDTATFAHIEALTWWEEGPRLAWVTAIEDTAGEPGPGTLRLWDGEDVRTAVTDEKAPQGEMIPAKTRLRWSEDGRRLFFGYRPEEPDTTLEVEGIPGPDDEGASEADTSAEEEEPFDPYDIDAIVADREVDVWHTEDPLIKSNVKQLEEEEKDRTWAAVYHLEDGRTVQLGDTLVDVQDLPDNPHHALGAGLRPYLKERTWVGFQQDLYVVDLDDGSRTKVAERLRGGGSTVGQWMDYREPSTDLSPGGRYAVYYKEGDWHLYDAARGASRNLTAGLAVPFYDVDHDYPEPAPGYGVAGWIEGDRAVLIHDKYDLWRFPTGGGEPVNLTAGRGRAKRRVLRALQVDPDREAWASDGWIHLLAFDEGDKSFGLFRTRADRADLEPLLDEEKRYDFVAKAKDADVLLFTREDYDEFPDLWVGDLWFGDARKLTDVNPQISEFAWGTSELIDWTSDDGIRLQGVVIKPGNYEEGKRYPVLTYFYRFFSQRLHEFNEPVVNHRPSFPIYASDGYIVFLPDVRFEVGRPGLSAVKSVVPGVKKLVELGWADPNALGLHGHSWSGYTTAFIVTQTDLFAAAVAGAPVSNMTSAYGGIRWGSGLARQFQYEQSQSRLGVSLWEDRSRYIENSPLFYADRIETPLLIEHGDEDDAVPWYQSIELYLALRRLGKPAVFLQYLGEPHHLRKYPNKVDYSIKMKEFFDHFLKGAPAPEWWRRGLQQEGATR